MSDDTPLLQVIDDVPLPPPPGGPITQIIGFAGDGSGNQLLGLVDVAVDGAGNVYAAGSLSDNVFKVTPAGVVTELIDASGDGVNPLERPEHVAIGATGTVYVSGRSSRNVFAIEPGDVITQIIDACGARSRRGVSSPASSMRRATARVTSSVDKAASRSTARGTSMRRPRWPAGCSRSRPADRSP